MDKNEPASLKAEIDMVLAEHEGNARAAIAALLHDIAVLAMDAESRTSLGYVRGKFARPAPRRKSLTG
jgi:hypothetical protein